MRTSLWSAVALCVVIAPAIAPRAASAQARPSPGEPARSLGDPSGGSGDRIETPIPPAPESYQTESLEGDAIPSPPSGEASGLRYPGDPRQPRPLTTDSGVRIPSGLATRLRALDSNFQVLAARGGGSIIDGVLSIVIGGAVIGVGIAIDVAEGGTGSGAVSVTPYLYSLGAASVLRGILDLALITNPSDAAITFAHMPMTTLEEVQARLEYGERELAGLADRSRLSRILDGSLSIASGLAIIPAYLAPNEFQLRSDFDWFVIIGAGVSAISGVITLLNSTDAERRWSAYEELRDRVQARGGDTVGQSSAADEASAESLDDLASIEREIAGRPRIEPVVGGGPGGVMVGLDARF